MRGYVVFVNFGVNFVSWFVMFKKRLSFVVFLGIGKFLMVSIFDFSGFIFEVVIF